MTTSPSTVGLPFPVEEYQDRWARLYAELDRRGHDAAIMFQRSGGGYDRAADVHWLCNYASLSSGQEPSYLGPVGKAFAVLVFHKSQEPTLHICEPVDLVDRDQIATARVIAHDNLPEGVGAWLREDSHPDCLLLGCTHFPILAPLMQRIGGPGLKLVDSAATTAAAVSLALTQAGLASARAHSNVEGMRRTLLATDGRERFARVGAHFLGEALTAEAVELVDL